METFRLITGMLGWFLFLFEVILLMSNNHFNFVLKNNTKLISISSVLSFLFTIISLLLGKLLYDKFDILMILAIILNFIPAISVIRETLKKDKVKEIIIKSNKDAVFVSDEERIKNYSDLNDFTGLMLTKHNNKEVLVVFETPLPNKKRDFDLVTEKHNDNGREFYLVTRVLYNKKSKMNYFDILFNFYTIIVATYGQVLVSKQYLLTSGTIGNDKAGSFLALPFAYAIFAFGTTWTSPKGNSFSKVFYYVFWAFKILIIIELLFIWSM